jgi:hypothetical protein
MNQLDDWDDLWFHADEWCQINYSENIDAFDGIKLLSYYQVCEWLRGCAQQVV